MKRWIAPAAGMFLVMGAASALAHHGWFGYDSNTTLTLTGSLSRVSYVNPHVEVELTAQDRRWTAVLAPPVRMEQRGLSKDSLKVGDVVTLIGYAHRANATEVRAERIVIAGKTVELR